MATPTCSDDATLKLESAKEILSEIFDISNPEVEEMIRVRQETRSFCDQALYDHEFHLD